MSTVQNSETCKSCKSEESLHSIFDCRTLEYDAWCEMCGYYYSKHLKRDENHVPIRKKKLKTSSPIASDDFPFIESSETDEYEYEWEIEEIKNPYGSLKITYKNHHYSISAVKDFEQFNDIKSKIAKKVEDGQKDDIAEVLFTRLVGPIVQKQVLFSCDNQKDVQDDPSK